MNPILMNRYLGYIMSNTEVVFGNEVIFSH